jgi:hypothetical protein
MIDVSGLAAMPDLSEAQSAAVARYRAAAERYTRTLGGPEAATQEGEAAVARERAMAALKAAQDALLKAFPRLTLVQDDPDEPH